MRNALKTAVLLGHTVVVSQY